MRLKREARVTGIDFNERTIELTASTDALCEDNCIILNRAWAKHYEAFLTDNPVVLKSHQYGEFALGHVLAGRLENYLLKERIQLDDVYPQAIWAWSLYSKGHQRAASVGWDTEEYVANLGAQEVLDKFGMDLSPETQTQLRGVVATQPQRRINVVTTAIKVETSLCAVGMDPGALSSMSKAKAQEALGRELTPELVTAGLEWGIRIQDGELGQEADAAMTRPGWEDTNPDDPKVGQLRFRIREPGLFQDNSFVSLMMDVKGTKDVQVVRGKLKDPPEGEAGKLVAQAIRFNKDQSWTMDAAKSWWADHEDDFRILAQLELWLRVDLSLEGQRIGKVINAHNMELLKQAAENLNTVIRSATDEPADEAHSGDADQLRGDVDWSAVLRSAQSAIHAGQLMQSLRELLGNTDTRG